jgi:hypothetical protein
MALVHRCLATLSLFDKRKALRGNSFDMTLLLHWQRSVAKLVQIWTHPESANDDGLAIVDAEFFMSVGCRCMRDLCG